MRSRISKWGNSLAVRIPRGLTEEAGLSDGSDVEITLRDGRIVIAPVGPEYHLDELVEGITSENRPTETDWGRPAGNEVW
ncbi:MAG TPA: AbrB/MazE/SpoVT family DNA-binding domain-containing protein [Gemmatimonadales bacterium]|nr:AbrB/MazE/SpoVT family DNA-binding domain-containing protein [Gemmatimonadales bacterium]